MNAWKEAHLTIWSPAIYISLYVCYTYKIILYTHTYCIYIVYTYIYLYIYVCIYLGVYVYIYIIDKWPLALSGSPLEVLIYPPPLSLTRPVFPPFRPAPWMFLEPVTTPGYRYYITSTRGLKGDPCGRGRDWEVRLLLIHIQIHILCMQ